MDFVKASIYNYSNLHEEDKKIADRLIQMVFEINLRKLFYLENKELPLEKQLSNKFKLEGIEVATRTAIDQTVSFICDAINSYEEEVEEIDTEDYFCGANYSTNLFEGLNILNDSRFEIKMSSYKPIH